MITRIKHRRIFLAALLVAVIVAASSFCFELEPSASEESRRGLDLWSESTEEEVPVPEVYAAEATPAFCELGSETETIAAEPENLLQGELNAARTNNKLQQEVYETALEQKKADTDALLPGNEDAVTADVSMETDIDADESSEEYFYEEEYSEEDDSTEDTDEVLYAWGSREEEDDGASNEDSYEESYEEETENEWIDENSGEEDVNEEESEEASFEEEAETEPQIDYSAYSDLDLLAAICQIEAGSNYEGALAVANVVLNRLHCGYAGSIYGVIFAPYQFATGSMDYYLQNGTSDTARAAAQDALNGINNVGSYLNFNGRTWLDPATLNCPYVEIGGNVFY